MQQASGNEIGKAPRKLGLRAGAQFKKLVPQQEKENFGFDSRSSWRGCTQSKRASSGQVRQRVSKALNRRLCWGETRILYYHDPRHVDVLVESLGLENGNTVQTQTIDDVKDENPVWLDADQIGLQPRQGRQNVRRERAVPENVRSFTTQHFQIEATRSVLEGRERMDPSYRLHGHQLTSEGFLRFRELELKKRGNRRARETFSIKQKIIARSSAEAELCAAASR